MKRKAHMQRKTIHISCKNEGSCCSLQSSNMSDICGDGDGGDGGGGVEERAV